MHIMNTNPLLTEWNTQYGLPPFDKIKPEHYEEAFEEAMAAHRAEIEAIAANSSLPDFENTLAAMDSSGELFYSITGVFFNLTASESSKALQEVERRLMPKLAAHDSFISLHEGLFARVEHLYQKRDELKLDGEQLALLSRLRLDFVRNGALLKGNDRKRYAEISQELASLSTEFSQNVLADEACFVLELNGPGDIDGLPGFILDAAKAFAAEKGLKGYAVNLSPSMVEPFMAFSSRRDLRKKLWLAYKARGEANPERDNKPVAEKIVCLRAELAKLMGYESYADYALDDRMAKTPKAVNGLLSSVWEAAKKRAMEEKEAMELIALREGFKGPIMAWDWDFYAEKLRKERYDLNESELKPYFSLQNMMNAMFEAAGRLYGIEFVEQKGKALYHPDVRLFEMRDRVSGELSGIFLSDNFTRSSKRGGAWMSDYRPQAKNTKNPYKYPIIVNNTNFSKAADGNASLLSLDELRTLFHEFGHALHGLLSNVTYKRLSGTNVLRDFVELPSQINEHWALSQEILKKHAIHTVTGEAITDKLIELIKNSEHFNQGFLTVAYTSCALIDMALHSVQDPQGIKLDEFEKSESQRLGVPEAIGMRHRLPHFRHLFSGDGYAAGYYVYMWAEVLDSDGFEAFEESGDVFNQELAQRFKRYVLSAGGSIDPAQAYRSFRGRDPDPKALLRGRGLA
ncbi:M3 family metallopeptidase [Spirochaetota bacterium]